MPLQFSLPLDHVREVRRIEKMLDDGERRITSGTGLSYAVAINWCHRNRRAYRAVWDPKLVTDENGFGALEIMAPGESPDTTEGEA